MSNTVEGGPSGLSSGVGTGDRTVSRAGPIDTGDGERRTGLRDRETKNCIDPSCRDFSLKIMTGHPCGEVTS